MKTLHKRLFSDIIKISSELTSKSKLFRVQNAKLGLLETQVQNLIVNEVSLASKITDKDSMIEDLDNKLDSLKADHK